MRDRTVITMASESENLERFIQEINRTADEAAAAVRKEARAYVGSALRQARDLVRQELAAAQFSELDKLIEKNNAALSEEERRETERLLQRRREIEQEVFAEAEKRLGAFTASDAYRELLFKSAARLQALFPDGAVFYIRPADETYAEELRSRYGAVELDGSIRLGGVRAVSADGKLAADDTLDSRFDACRRDFYAKSGLSVTL